MSTMPTRTVAVIVFLCALTVAIYGEVGRFEFIGVDDLTFVADNALISRGLTVDGLLEAFTSLQSGFWIPLTWLSLMADVSFLGPGAGGMHVVNAAFHAVNGALLFLVLCRLTGAPWRSAAVAAIFIVHPLRVESVAWVIERKDVLSTLFMLVALHQYVRFVRRRSRARLAAAVAAMAASLMCKPMLVTFPVLLLVVDYWPLGRWRATGASAAERSVVLRSLFIEKVPFLLVSAAAAALLVASQRVQGSLHTLEAFPLVARLAKGVSSPSIYLQRFFWPVDLRFGPPLGPYDLPWEVPVLAAVVLVAVTVGALAARRVMPAVVAGWLWYLIALVPVSGLVPSGKQGFENRFTYIPQLGVALAIIWWASDSAGRRSGARRTVALCVVVAVLALAGLSRKQVGVWHDGVSLFGDAVRRFPDDIWSRQALGNALQRQAWHSQAIEQFEEILARRPGDATALWSIGVSLGSLGRIDDSRAYFERAIAVDPANPDAHFNLAVALRLLGSLEEAAWHYRQALLARPRDVETRFNLALLLLEQGQVAEARNQFAEVVRLAPWTDTAKQYLARLSENAAPRGGADLVSPGEKLR